MIEMCLELLFVPRNILDATTPTRSEQFIYVNGVLTCFAEYPGSNRLAFQFICYYLCIVRFTIVGRKISSCFAYDMSFMGALATLVVARTITTKAHINHVLAYLQKKKSVYQPQVKALYNTTIYLCTHVSYYNM